MRAAPVIVLACLATAAAGCGGEHPQQARRPDPPVKLSVTSPADDSTVRSETVEVEGTVEPAGATVLVLGQKAPVSGGGSFSARDRKSVV